MSTRKKINWVFCSVIIISITILLEPVSSKGIVSQLFSQDESVLVASTDESTVTINPSDKQRFLEHMSEIYDYVKLRYYKEVDDTIITEGALSGLISNLGDPYSVFITEEKAQEYEEDIQGTFGGLGIFIDEGLDEETGTHYIKVVSPIESTPAFYVGLQPGDLILSVDGESTAEMSSTDAVKILRGEPGTKVSLSIKRGSKIFDVKLIREIINTVDLRGAHINDDTAYIKIIRFNQKTPEEFSDVVKDLDKKGYKNLIIDLRNNPGGSLQGVLQTLNFFFRANTLLVSTQSRIEKENKEYKTNALQLIPDDKNIVVIINRGSASASEIFAGAIKDNNRGSIVGEVSFGKGLVQSVVPYYGGYITMTISQYFTPSGDYINEKGVHPHVVIKDDEGSQLSPAETLYMADVLDRNLVQTFIEDRKGKLDDNSVEELQKQLAEEGYIIHNLAYLKHILYVFYNKYENVMPVYSLEMDSVLTQTLEFITKKSK